MIGTAIQKIRSGLAHINRQYRRGMMAALYRKGRQADPSRGPILFWVPGGMPVMLYLETAIAAALKLRGQTVHAVICDGVYSACIRREITDEEPVSNWKNLCGSCKKRCSRVLDTMGIPFSYIGDHVGSQELIELRQRADAVNWGNISDLAYDEVNVGSNAKSAVQRYLQGNDMVEDQSLINEYAFSGLVCAAAAKHAIDEMKPTGMFMSHGLYVDWGPALRTAVSRGIPLTAWMASYLPVHFYFRNIYKLSDIDFHAMSDTAWEEISASVMSDEQKHAVEQFFHNRYQKDTSFDMKQFKQYTGDPEELRKNYALDSNRPVWGIMAHINWDAVSDSAPMVYDTFNDWMDDSIRVIREVTDVQWVIKIHPAEVWCNAEKNVEFLINRDFPDLPEHIRVLPASENISPQDFLELIDGGITVYGTAGLELALKGKPTILAGEAHYGSKGFTHDAESREHYRSLLRRASSISRLEPDQLALAFKYAYCYFVQRQIPISVVKAPESRWWHFQYNKRELLLERRDPVIDFICERITDGKDFIMSEDLVRQKTASESSGVTC